MSDLYILKGKQVIPCDDYNVWGVFMKGKRDVGKTNIGEILISTVFLGMDHRFGGNGLPIIFETMVFGGELDQEQERYCTWDEAEIGHAEMIERVKSEAAKTTKDMKAEK